MKLNEVPFEKISVGDRVVSALGRIGYIKAIVPEDDNSIWIEWEGGGRPKESLVYHHLSDRISYLGP